MNSKDIRFATQEYIFNVQCKESTIDLKVNMVYEYRRARARASGRAGPL